jgi:hypothetical protein
MADLPPTSAIEIAELSSDQLQRKYQDFLRQNPRLAEQYKADLASASRELIPYNLHPNPIFIDEAHMRSLRSTSEALTSLIKSLPKRIFKNDPIEIANFYSLGGPWIASLALSEPNEIGAALCRLDFIRSREGFKCLEANLGSPGGWLVSALAPLYCKGPLLNRFLVDNRLRLSFPNTIRKLMLHLIEQIKCSAAYCSAKEINVGVSVAPADAKEFSPAAEEFCRSEYHAALTSVASSLSGDFCLCSETDLALRDGLVYYRGKQLHLLLETSRASRNGEWTYRAFKGGRVCICTGPAASILSDKRNFALLSEESDRGGFSDSEQKLIRSCVPWTRRVLPEHTLYEGELIDLPSLLINRRDKFIIKHARSSNGEQVFLGHATATPAWKQVIDHALIDGNWVAQEYVDSCVDSPSPGALNGNALECVWGPFILGKSYAGGFNRILTRGGYRQRRNREKKSLDFKRADWRNGIRAHSISESHNADSHVAIVPIFEVNPMSRVPNQQ